MQGQLPAEPEHGVGSEKTLLERLLTPIQLTQLHALGHFAIQIARPHHWATGLLQSRRAFVDQGEQFVWVQGDLIGNP